MHNHKSRHTNHNYSSNTSHASAHNRWNDDDDIYGYWSGHGGGNYYGGRRHCHATFSEIPFGTPKKGALLAGAGIDVDKKSLEAANIDIFVPMSGSAFDSCTTWFGDIAGMPMADFGCWPTEVLKRRAEQVLAWVNNGKRVGIACTGGHGRTGTLLAAVMLADKHVEASKNPVGWIRQNYCKSAIESWSQEATIHELAGLPIPEKPVYKSTYKGTYSTYKGGTTTYPKKPSTYPSKQTSFPSHDTSKTYVYRDGKVVPLATQSGVSETASGKSTYVGGKRIDSEISGPYNNKNGSALITAAEAARILKKHEEASVDKFDDVFSAPELLGVIFSTDKACCIDCFESLVDEEETRDLAMQAVTHGYMQLVYMDNVRETLQCETCEKTFAFVSNVVGYEFPEYRLCSQCTKEHSVVVGSAKTLYADSVLESDECDMCSLPLRWIAEDNEYANSSDVVDANHTIELDATDADEDTDDNIIDVELDDDDIEILADLTVDYTLPAVDPVLMTGNRSSRR